MEYIQYLLQDQVKARTGLQPTYLYDNSSKTALNQWIKTDLGSKYAPLEIPEGAKIVAGHTIPFTQSPVALTNKPITSVLPALNI